MPSVLGLLEAREKKVREEVAQLREEAERVQAALDAAECALQRLTDARATVAEVLAEPLAEEVGQARAVVAGRVVPERAEGVGIEVLAPEYQQIMQVLAARDAAGGLRIKPIALALGWEMTPARIEGVRSRVRRLAARGWATELRPNVFTAPPPVSAAD
ncbi:hypothetical protein [Streptomyces natalensis]|uniref:Uncharacterized protein n=1 Tax=Streptomyces natalensis ATCC 27448 TaxID=1240678 RepID=A0A0D7CQE6_9ACTN|nr:hypothetical protein [Streptomyces natalensis]KIZ18459.1 hypothetical protein SNA_07550 [Streptomyces natalensis ATCC 27448]